MFPSGYEHIITGIGISVIHQCIESGGVFGPDIMNHFLLYMEVVDNVENGILRAHIVRIMTFGRKYDVIIIQ